MISLEINSSSAESVRQSFYMIAKMLFNDIQLQVNRNYYRLLDIEFYYFAPGIFEDVYAHRHPEQQNMGKWYFHGSGIDITIGNGIDHYGGILIRGIALLSGEVTPEKHFVKKEIHGPLNVKTELCSGLYDVFSDEKNTFQLLEVSEDRLPAGMPMPKQIIETIRIGLSETKDNSPKKEFYNDRTRFVIFPHLKLKNKSRIATDMEWQFPELSKSDINKLLGSTFLK